MKRPPGAVGISFISPERKKQGRLHQAASPILWGIRLEGGNDGSAQRCQPFVRGRTASVSCRTAGFPHHGTSDLVYSNRALALPQQCSGHVLCSRGKGEVIPP